jgi:hypothetical protein
LQETDIQLLVEQFSDHKILELQDMDLARISHGGAEKFREAPKPPGLAASDPTSMSEVETYANVIFPKLVIVGKLSLWM